MTLNYLSEKQVIIFLQARFHENFQNLPNKCKLSCDIEDAVSHLTVAIHFFPNSILNNCSSAIGPDLFWLQGEPCSIKVFSLAKSLTLFCLSLPLSLFLGVPGKPQISGFESAVPEGGKVTLTCTSTGSKPPARLRWYRGDQELEGERHRECVDAVCVFAVGSKTVCVGRVCCCTLACTHAGSVCVVRMGVVMCVGQCV